MLPARKIHPRLLQPSDAHFAIGKNDFGFKNAKYVGLPKPKTLNMKFCKSLPPSLTPKFDFASKSAPKTVPYTIVRRNSRFVSENFIFLQHRLHAALLLKRKMFREMHAYVT